MTQAIYAPPLPPARSIAQVGGKRSWSEPRPANLADAKALVRLKIALAREAEHMIFDVRDRGELLRRTTVELSAAVAGERGIFVLQRIGDLVGYIDVRSVCIEGAAEFASFNLAIRTRWQGRGLGPSLVKSAEEWVRRRRIPFLIFHVAVRNDRAFALYQRLGYTVCGDVVAANKESGVVGDYYAMGRMLDADEVALA